MLLSILSNYARGLNFICVKPGKQNYGRVKSIKNVCSSHFNFYKLRSKFEWVPKLKKKHSDINLVDYLHYFLAICQKNLKASVSNLVRILLIQI